MVNIDNIHDEEIFFGFIYSDGTRESLIGKPVTKAVLAKASKTNPELFMAGCPSCGEHAVIHSQEIIIKRGRSSRVRSNSVICRCPGSDKSFRLGGNHIVTQMRIAALRKAAE